MQKRAVSWAGAAPNGTGMGAPMGMNSGGDIQMQPLMSMPSGSINLNQLGARGGQPASTHEPPSPTHGMFTGNSRDPGTAGTNGAASLDGGETVGQLSDTLSSLASKDQTKVSFDFNDLGLKLNTNGLQVLAGVTGQLPAGSVTAIMGPSGAGKTTFINALSGKATYGRLTGRVRINGRVQSIDRFSNLIGFVPQDDIMLRELTVKETLGMYAKLRLPEFFSPEQVDAVTEDVIEILGLEKIQHSVIGDETKRGISGDRKSVV